MVATCRDHLGVKFASQCMLAARVSRRICFRDEARPIRDLHLIRWVEWPQGLDGISVRDGWMKEKRSKVTAERSRSASGARV